MRYKPCSDAQKYELKLIGTTMSYLRFDKTLMINLQESLPREILRTNRSGAYHCTTIVDCNTRKMCIRDSAEYETSDTSESINTYFNHFV